MKVRRFDGGPRENLVVTGIIVSDEVIAKLADKCTEHPFGSAVSNIIVEQCIAYYRQHQKAPGKHIEPIMRVWAEGRSDGDQTVEMVTDYLTGLSGEYQRLGKELNPHYVLDEADKRINEVKLRRLLESAEAKLSTGHLDDAWEEIQAVKRVPINEQAKFSLLADKQEVFSAFAEDSEAVVKYPGDAGKFFGDALASDSFVVFLAPEKTGKTFWLLDLAFRAFCQRKRVAYFEAGDMSKRQIKRRFLARIASHPYRSTNEDCSWPCEVNYPTAIQSPSAKDGVAEVKHRIWSFKEALNGPLAWAACRKLRRNIIKSFKEYFWLECHPNSTLTVADIDAKLVLWAAEDWVADVVVIDYADILAPPKGTGRMDGRDRTNEIWKQLRRLSQERHCLVVTATQTKAAAYEQDRPLDRRSFSEDKRKNAHCTSMIGINVRASDKAAGVMRLNWAFKREGDFRSDRYLHCATCLPLAEPCVLSTF